MAVEIKYYGKAPTLEIREDAIQTRSYMIKNNYKQSVYDVYDGIDIKATTKTKVGANKYMKKGRTIVGFIVK